MGSRGDSGNSGGGSNRKIDLTPLPIKIAKEVFIEGPRRSKQNVADYEGQAAGVTPMRAPRTITRDNDNDNNNEPSVKSVEQPKVAAQMDNTGVKSDMIIADKTAPTSTEMTDDEYSLDTKKRGRKKTIMTSVTGDTTPTTLSKKTLLGG